MGDGITNELQVSLDAWNTLPPEERITAFQQLPYAEKDDFFLALSARDQAELILSLPPGERRIWARLLPPDDATDLIQEAPEEERAGLMALMDDYTRREVGALLAYAEEEASEDIQKIGGMEALEGPYLQVQFAEMVKKRGGWLAALFLGEMLTATAMGFFEQEIARAVVLALFIPLIISSGGNSGSQATSLVIRAMALGEVRLRDWWRVVRREIGAGLALGCMLASIGLVRILAWHTVRPDLYGPHYLLVAMTVACSLIGVVLFGTVVGSMLPFILRSLSFDPASASAPFVATLVDVTGLVIYFTVASIILRGTLL